MTGNYLDVSEELDLALRLADAADAVTLPRYKAVDLVVETKPDVTPVTEADRRAERTLVGILAAERPHHSALGEEFGASGSGDLQWVIDPIDATMNYVRGIPVWGTLIGLVLKGRPIVGVVSAPSLHRRWWAGKGLGAFVNGDPIAVSKVAAVEDAQVSLNAVSDFEQVGMAEAIKSLVDTAWRVRGFGDFWSHMLVAEGAADVAVEAAVNPWDMAAVQMIVEEAGGRFTDLSGQPSFEGGNALSTNGVLHEPVLRLFDG